MQLSAIRIDGGTQPRAQIDETIVAEYAEAMSRNATFPPVVLFFDGVDHWLADGFHRYHAARRIGSTDLPADVRTGTQRDAILYSVGANAAHGLRRTHADKRKAVLLLLNDTEWAGWANAEIARRCGVDSSMVDDWRRKHLPDSGSCKPRTYIHHESGKPTTMKTENIGKHDTGLRMKDGRKLVLPAGRKLSSERAVEIAELAAIGHRAAQIAAILGIGEFQVRRLADAGSIELPDAGIGKTRRIDSHRVIEQAVLGLDAGASALNTIPISFDEITAAQARDWAESVAESLAIYRKFHRQLVGVSHG